MNVGKILFLLYMFQGYINIIALKFDYNNYCVNSWECFYFVIYFF